MSKETMKGCVLLGNRQVEVKEFPIPTPGKNQVLLKIKASSICGTDLHVIYRIPKEEWRTDQEGYFGVIAGHEPAGQVVQLGPGVERFKVGQRVTAFHVSGCGFCADCRMGRLCSCTTKFDPVTKEGRKAYGFQMDGGHAEYMLANAESLVALPDQVSYQDGAMMACGYGTAYSAVSKTNVSGKHRVFVAGLGPVGLAVVQICLKLGAFVEGYDASEKRRQTARQVLKNEVDSGKFKVIDNPDQVDVVDHGCVPLDIGYDYAFECAGAEKAREMSIKAVRRWGTCVFIGGYGSVTLDCSPWILQKQITLKGSWTCSVGELENLARDLVKWDLHPDSLVSHTFSIQDSDKAYQTFDKGDCLKVCIVD